MVSVAHYLTRRYELMVTMNISEENTLSLFGLLGISLNKIPESQSKTPDFEATLDGSRSEGNT